jgi:hypothetical protein
LCCGGFAALGWVPGRVWGEAGWGYARVREYSLLVWDDLFAETKPNQTHTTGGYFQATGSRRATGRFWWRWRCTQSQSGVPVMSARPVSVCRSFPFWFTFWHPPRSQRAQSSGAREFRIGISSERYSRGPLVIRVLRDRRRLSGPPSGGRQRVEGADGAH